MFHRSGSLDRPVVAVPGTATVMTATVMTATVMTATVAAAIAVGGADRARGPTVTCELSPAHHIRAGRPLSGQESELVGMLAVGKGGVVRMIEVPDRPLGPDGR
jgi:hypothetical protein